ncbi:hypothetical protein HY988_04185 [Candidatus Micrarchaeota archaeon]|nr:hypothetical protein [Candidatus Micrarchaeota archaeon]
MRKLALVPFALALGAATAGCAPFKQVKPVETALAPQRHPNFNRARAMKYFFDEKRGCSEVQGPYYDEAETLSQRLGAIMEKNYRGRWDFDRQKREDPFDIRRNMKRILALADQISFEPSSNPPIEVVDDEEEIKKKCKSNLAQGCCLTLTDGHEIKSEQIYVYNGKRSSAPTISFSADGDWFNFDISYEGSRPITTLGHELGHSRDLRRISGTGETAFKELEAMVFSLRLTKAWAQKHGFREGYDLLIEEVRDLEKKVGGYVKTFGQFTNLAEFEARYDTNYNKIKIKKEEKDELKPYILADLSFAVLIYHFSYDLDKVYQFIHTNTHQTIKAEVNKQLARLPDLAARLKGYRQKLELEENAVTDKEFKQLLQDLAVAQVKATGTEKWEVFRKHHNPDGSMVMYGVGAEHFLVMEFDDQEGKKLRKLAVYSKCEDTAWHYPTRGEQARARIGISISLGDRPVVEIGPASYGVEYDCIIEGDCDKGKYGVFGAANPESFPFPNEKLGFERYATNELPQRERPKLDEKRKTAVLGHVDEIIAGLKDWIGIPPMDF